MRNETQMLFPAAQRLGMLALSLLLPGCAKSVIGESLTAAIVEGTVQTAANVPVAGATVRVTAYGATCTGAILGQDAGVERPITDQNGTFSLLVQSHLGPQSVCLVVTAVTASKRDTVRVSRTSVALKDLELKVLDTVRVTVVVPG